MNHPEFSKGPNKLMLIRLPLAAEDAVMLFHQR